MHGDLITVLRHLAENAQWGGNRGEREETFEALDRLTEGFRREAESQHPSEPAETPAETPETPKTGNATPTKATGRKTA